MTVTRAHGTCQPEKRPSCTNWSPLMCTVSKPAPFPAMWTYPLQQRHVFCLSSSSANQKPGVIFSVCYKYLAMWQLNIILKTHTTQTVQPGQDSTVSIETGQDSTVQYSKCRDRTTGWNIQSSIRSRDEIYVFFESALDVTLPTHLQLVPKLILSGAIPVLPLYVSRTWPDCAKTERQASKFGCQFIRMSHQYATQQTAMHHYRWPKYLYLLSLHLAT